VGRRTGTKKTASARPGGGASHKGVRFKVGSDPAFHCERTAARPWHRHGHGHRHHGSHGVHCVWT